MRRAKLLWTWGEVLAEVPWLRERLEAFADVTVAHPAPAELAGRLAGHDVLVPRLSHTIDEPLLAAAALRLIGTPSTGSDHIDVAAAARRGIPVVRIKDDRALLDSIQSTAELAWLLVLSCVRNLRAATAHVLRGRWEAGEVRGHELIGRTLGIVGHGRLGTMVGRFGKAFRMKVLAADPAGVDDPRIEAVGLEELLRRSDVVTLHVHLTEATRRLIGPREFALMKPGAVLVNTSRGGVVDEAALLDALAAGRLAAAGLDVIDGERDPKRADSPLLRYAAAHDNLVITPHVGGCTFEAQAKAFTHFADKLRRAWEALGPIAKG
ncbi:MAG: hypothetical protein GX591_04315 [Planctomycetes bacterium]|nr:hypothetical protein [Planctomycetota bacterium]